MPNIALFPGSFDPITIGHAVMAERALPLFDKIVIGVGTNSQKKYLFSLEERMAFIAATFEANPKIEILHYEELTVNFARRIGANFLLRGIRTSADFEFERSIAQLNHTLAPEIETVFFASLPQYSHISSTIVREVIINGGNASPFLHPKAWEMITQKKLH